MITINFDTVDGARNLLEETEFYIEEYGSITLDDIYDLFGMDHALEDCKVKFSSPENFKVEEDAVAYSSKLIIN